MGNMTGIRYPNTEVWLDYEYDKMGRVIAIPGFAGTRTNPGFTYDANSALAAVQMDNKIRTEYSRDRNGRVTGIIANSLSGEDILNLALGYDAANNIISRNDNAYIYDKVNRLQRATVRGNFEDKFTKADMILGTVAFDYFGDKEMVEEATDQTQVKLDYGARSLVLNLLTEAENICRIELTPEEAGHRVQVDQIKIFYKKNEYFTVLDKERWTAVKDDQGRIIITFDPYLTATELKIHCNFDDLDYWQQPVDRSEFYNSPENLVTVYQKVKYRTESYEYDAMGNRTVERHLLRKEYAYYYEYYAKSNRLKTNGRFAYEYDANGNLIRKGNRYEIDGETVTFVTSGEGVEYWEYYYDLFNRLEEVKKNGETVARYLYDPNGFRVEKLSRKGKVHYVQLLNGEVGYRKEITVNKEYSFIYFAGFHLARVDGVIGGTGRKYFYHNDHLGSALAVTDEEGNKVIERDFLPFGEIINLQEGPNPYVDGSGFTGKDWDEEIGLYYFNARWYDPEIGRFISQDPAADDPNLYSYGYNNPLKFVDPNGMNAESFLGNVDIKIDIKGGMLNLAAQNTPEFGMLLQGISAFNFLIDDYRIIGLSTAEIENILLKTCGEASVDVVKRAIGDTDLGKYVKEHGINTIFALQQHISKLYNDDTRRRLIAELGVNKFESTVTVEEPLGRGLDTMAYVADATWFLASGDKIKFADDFARAFNLSLPSGYKMEENSKLYNIRSILWNRNNFLGVKWGDYLGLPATGWKESLLDQTNGESTYEDQAHHFSALFWYTAHYGSFPADVAGYLNETSNLWKNKADITLGFIAVDAYKDPLFWKSPGNWIRFILGEGGGNNY